MPKTVLRSYYVTLCSALVAALVSPLCAQQRDFITTKMPIRLLSANDGDTIRQLDDDGLFDKTKRIQDSITVIDLGPDDPPKVRTVYGTVPSTIFGAPYISMSLDGRLGFVNNHAWRIEDRTDDRTDFSKLPADRQNCLKVVDLTTPTLRVIQTVPLPQVAFGLGRHPDGRLVVSCGEEFHVFEVGSRGVTPRRTNASPIFIISFDISPQGDRIIATGVANYTKETPPDELDIQVHAFSFEGNQIDHLNRVEIDESLGRIDGPFAPRFSPDGARAIVLNGIGTADKGQLDDVLSIDMSLTTPKVTEVVRQVADGLESLAFHPNNHMAVVTCLNRFANPAYARLAVIDLSSKPIRLLSQMPIETMPEGIEFTPDGEKLFVGCTHAHHIAVFDVEGFRLKRSPFVLQTGHGHASLAIAQVRSNDCPKQTTGK